MPEQLTLGPNESEFTAEDALVVKPVPVSPEVRAYAEQVGASERLQSAEQISEAYAAVPTRQVFPGDPDFDGATPFVLVSFPEGKMNHDTGDISSPTPPVDPSALSKEQQGRIAVSLGSMKSMLADKAKKEAWWLQGENIESYMSNPFEHDATEQYIIQIGERAVSVLNYGEALTADHVASLERAIALIDEATGGRANEIIPQIIIHNEFPPSSEHGSADRDTDAGRSGSQNQIIEINRSRLDDEIGRLGDNGVKLSNANFLERLLVHEASHKIEAKFGGIRTDESKKKSSQFGQELGWTKNHEGEFIADTPSDILVGENAEGDSKRLARDQIYSSEQLANSKPPSVYGATRRREDFAESMTTLIFDPESLDPIRRDVLIGILQRLHQGEVTATAPVEIQTRHRTGDGIIYPKLKIPKEIAYKIIPKEFTLADQVH